MKDKQKKKQKAAPALNAPLSASKKRVFFSVTLSLPLILFLLLEISLRVFNYGGNLDLFIDGPPGYENYLRCNPNVARRYFDVQSTIPTPPLQLFRKEKQKNGYRIFVLGESSTAGFPYGTNVSFPNVLERALANTFPERDIEVINVAMSAICSYTLADLTDEILSRSPDAVLIYTGHNEYYGALGVGSSQSLGKFRWLVHAYLKLQSLKTFVLLRDVIGWVKVQISSLFFKGSEIDPTATLMERIVADQTIPYGSPLYEAGREQFRENMDAVLQKASGKGITVVLGELVSNLRDQEPFITVGDEKGTSAKSYFNSGLRFEAAGEFEKAKMDYRKAKDYDALRFRASEEFNMVIRELAKKYSSPLVPSLRYFENNSPNGLIGNNLMLEHLHPNKDGYYLLAKAFYETMREHRMVDTAWQRDGIAMVRNEGITALDSVYASLVVRHLKGSWPFQPRGLPNRFAEVFQPANYLEEVAFRILPSENYNLISGHHDLGAYYEKRGELDNAFAEYLAQVVSIPHEMEFYKSATTVLLKQKRYNEASALLFKSLRYKESPFADKWIGQIAYMQNDFKKAISFLRKADMSDSQVLFNLSRTYYSDNQWEMGEEYFQRLSSLSPQSEYVAYLMKFRTALQLQQKLLKQRVN